MLIRFNRIEDCYSCPKIQSRQSCCCNGGLYSLQQRAFTLSCEEALRLPSLHCPDINSSSWLSDSFGKGRHIPLQELMVGAVLAKDGLTYDRLSIKSWFSLGKQSSPCINEVIGIQLMPNIAVQEAVGAFMRAFQWCQAFLLSFTT